MSRQGLAAKRSVALVTRSLDTGGAERQLTLLATGLKEEGWHVTVVAFYENSSAPERSPLTRELALREIPHIVVGKAGRWDVLPFIVKLTRTLRELRPSIVSSFLEIPNLIVGALRPLLRGAAIVWNVRVAFVDLSRFDALTRASFRLHSMGLRMANLVVVNSERGAAWVGRNGRPRDLVVIRNGVDLDRFRADPSGGVAARQRLGLSGDRRVVLLPARFDPMKDHITFLRAVALIDRDDIEFVCAGAALADDLERFEGTCQELAISDRVRWLPAQEDMAALYSSSDVVTLSSYGEGFPNVVAEAMACEVPCVVTDVGDAAAIVGDLGIVVPPRDPEALASGWTELLSRIESEGGELGRRCRIRIAENFSAQQMVRETSGVFESLLARGE